MGAVGFGKGNMHAQRPRFYTDSVNSAASPLLRATDSVRVGFPNLLLGLLMFGFLLLHTVAM